MSLFAQQQDTANFLDTLIGESTRIFLVLVVVIFFWIIWGLILRRLQDKLSPELYNALRTLGRATILLLGIFWIAGEELFIGAAALLGTAIGFASSTTIGNFISGLYLLITNPFNVGDYVMIPSLKIEGIVEEISINYTKILTPNGIHVSISNQKLLGAAIHNTNIQVPEEAVDKGKITWKDHEGDKFDSTDDVIDVLKGLRAKYTSETEEYFLYPLIFNLNPDKYSHTLSKTVFNETAKKFSNKTVEEITWFMIDRSNYQVNLIVKNPYSIFDLKNEVLGYLEERIEEVHK